MDAKDTDGLLAAATSRRITLRLMPYLFLLYIVAFLDRVNVSFAGLEMSRDLHFSDRVFGLGAGIFFIGYVVFEIPCALLVERWSARRLIARILISWGLVTILVALVRTAGEFYAARFLLGAAEAGFFPGILVYLTHWFRYEDRAKAAALFTAAIPVANLIGSPLAGVILGVRWAGWPGWRWLFVLEGIPAVVLGLITLNYLTDWPKDAKWLSPEERRWITGELLRERAATGDRTTLLGALRMPKVLLLTGVYFLAVSGIYGFVVWFPTILKRVTGFSNLLVTLLAALPFLAGLAAMLWNGWHSDRTGERRWHTAIPMLVGAASLAGAVLTANLLLAFALMVIAGAATTAFLPSFWPMPTRFLSGSAAAAAIGLINSIGNLGGFLGPYAVGALRSHTGSFTPGLLVLLVAMAGGGALVLALPKSGREAGPDSRRPGSA
jgi:MFS transporter, ACS family, tartrate transporter